MRERRPAEWCGDSSERMRPRSLSWWRPPGGGATGQGKRAVGCTALLTQTRTQILPVVADQRSTAEATKLLRAMQMWAEQTVAETRVRAQPADDTQDVAPWTTRG